MKKTYRHSHRRSIPLASVFCCERSQQLHTWQSLTIGRVVTTAIVGILFLSFQLSDVRAVQAQGQQANSTPELASGTSKRLKTGREFRKALQAPCSIDWKPTLLRRGLNGLAEANEIAIFLDRRIDPDKSVSIKIDDRKLDFVLYSIAQQLKLGVCFEADVVYFGPVDAVDRLPTLLAYQKQRFGRLPEGNRKLFAAQTRLEWPRLSEPRDLVTQVVSRYGFSSADTQSVPHDVWNAWRLPAGSIEEQLTFLLLGFDMMCVMSKDGTELKMVTIPEAATPEVEYRIPRQQIAKLKIASNRTTKAELDRETGKLKLKAGFAQHARVYRFLNPPPREESTAGAEGEQVYSLSITAPAGSVLATIANILDCEVRYEDSLLAKLKEQVKIEASKASVDELLRQALEPLDLEYVRDGNDLVIVRKGR